MRRALRRAGWALTAGLGMTAAAAAQSPPERIIGPGGHVEAVGETVVMTEAQARLEEGQVELAFLADPMLFAYGLGAHVQAGELEVRGYVPNETVRDQAMRVATAQSGLHVLDRLKLHPTLAGHGAVDKPDNICRAARALLAESFPEHGKAMEVRCDARGHVTVSGKVGSYEDKVLVSRKLRQVPGCSCVVNQLSLAGATHVAQPAPKTHTTGFVEPVPPPVKPSVTKREPSPVHVAPRKHDGPAPLPEIAPAPKHGTLAQPVIDVPPPVAPPAVPPVHRPSLPPVPVVVPEKAPAPKPMTVALPVIEKAPAPTPTAVAPPAIEKAPAPKPTVVTLPAIEKAPRPVVPESHRPSLPDVVTEKAPAPKPAPVKQPVIEKAPLPAVPVAPAPPVSLPPVSLPPVVPDKAPAAKQPTISIPPLPGASERHRSALPPVLPPVVAPPSKAPADKPVKGASEESYVTEGTITFADDPPAPPKPVKPAKTVVPAKTIVPAKTAVPQKPATSVLPPVSKTSAPVTLTATPAKGAEGTLTFDAPPARTSKSQVTQAPKPLTPPAPAAPARPTAPPAVRLKERIQTACGPAYDVRVATTTIKGKSVLQVNITGRDEADGKRLMEKIGPILKLPEFTALEINAEVVYPTK
jgi:BON domain-containing protein